jgi:hypothetical protein
MAAENPNASREDDETISLPFVVTSGSAQIPWLIAPLQTTTAHTTPPMFFMFFLRLLESNAHAILEVSRENPRWHASC